MPALFRSAAVALAFAGAVYAQSSSVISVFLPDTDQQTLVGSLVASDASKTTIAFGCPSDEDSSDCGYGVGQVTATFGPSTLIYTMSVESLTLGLNCAVTGTTAAMCTQTYIGPIGALDDATATDDSLTATNTQITTSVTSTSLAQSDITFMPITLTAFANAAGGTSAGTGGSGSVSGATQTSPGAQTTATSSGSETANTATHTGAAMALGGSQGKWAIAGTAGFVGLAAMVL